MRILATYSAILAILATAISGQKTTPLPYDDAEAYAVYSAVLFKEWPVREAKAKALVIQLETTGFKSFGTGDIGECLIPPKGEESIYEPVFNSYRDANKEPRVLLPKFTTAIPYRLVAKADFDAFFAKDGIGGGWEEFYKKYPNSGGINHMSAVGFNSDRTIAIVYVGHSCGGLCGGGTYHVLKKSDGRWAEIEWHGGSCSWVS